MSEQYTALPGGTDNTSLPVEKMKALLAGHIGLIVGVPRRYPAMASAVAAVHRIYGIPVETLGELYRELVGDRGGPPWHTVAAEVPAVLAEWDAKRSERRTEK